MQHGDIWSVTLNVVLLYFINKNQMQQSPPLSRGRPGHLSYFYGYQIQFITLMSHTVPQYSFHISYSLCYVTHLLSFAAVRSFLRSKPTVFALLHLLGSHVASDTLQTKATRSDIFDLISLSASYTRIYGDVFTSITMIVTLTKKIIADW